MWLPGKLSPDVCSPWSKNFTLACLNRFAELDWFPDSLTRSDRPIKRWSATAHMSGTLTGDHHCCLTALGNCPPSGMAPSREKNPPLLWLPGAKIVALHVARMVTIDCVSCLAVKVRKCQPLAFTQLTHRSASPEIHNDRSLQV